MWIAYVLVVEYMQTRSAIVSDTRHTPAQTRVDQDTGAPYCKGQPGLKESRERRIEDDTQERKDLHRY